MNMIKSERLEELCRELCNYPPVWEDIIARFKSHPNFDSSNSFDLRFYAKHFSEIHLDLCLEEIARTHPEFSISLKPLQEGSETESYRFNYSLVGRLFAYPKDGTAPREYDALITIDSLPVVFEVKMDKWYRPNMKKRNYKREIIHKRGGIYPSLESKHVKWKLKPVQQFFDSDAGYVFVIPKEYYERPPDKKLYSARFMQNKGIFVPFYATRRSYRQEVLQKASENGLNIKVF